MNFKTINSFKAMCLGPLTVLCIVSAPAQAQTAPAMAPSANMPMGQMHKGGAGPHDMKASMMMKMHHQQAVNMAEMELANGKSSEMKAMAKQIIVAQKKEIAQFDKWLAKQK